MNPPDTDSTATPPVPPKASHRPELEGIVARFRTTFMAEVKWPDVHDLRRFRELVPLAYVELGNKKPKPVQFWSMVKGIDARWKGIHLIEALERMVQRCVKGVPKGPRRRLLDLLVTKQVAKPIEHPLFTLLGKTFVAKSEAKWSDFKSELDGLLSKDTADALKRVPLGLVPDNDVAWLKFLDVHRQALAWRAEYGKQFENFAFWVYSLKNDELFESLKVLGFETARIPTSDEWQTRHQRRLGNTRQRRFRENE